MHVKKLIKWTKNNNRIMLILPLLLLKRKVNLERWQIRVQTPLSKFQGTYMRRSLGYFSVRILGLHKEICSERRKQAGGSRIPKRRRMWVNLESYTQTREGES